MPDLHRLQEGLGYNFAQPELLCLALTHPSVAHEREVSIDHNQRLEFLGDAVLQLVLTAELYAKFPDVEEGPLTQARAQMVNRRTLAEQGLRIGLGEYLWLSKGESLSGGRERASTLADAFEALLGALYLDGGIGAARAFILRQFHDAFGKLEVIPNLENPKGELQELLQANSNEAPEYRLESVSGPDHNRHFVSVVYHLGKELARGTGKSKKTSESEAARAALETLEGSPADNA